jgi:hypothetical protein
VAIQQSALARQVTARELALSTIAPRRYQPVGRAESRGWRATPSSSVPIKSASPNAARVRLAIGGVAGKRAM